MVSTALRETVDALSVDERVSLLEYLERTTDFPDEMLTDEQIAMLDRRAAEMKADPSRGIPSEQLIKRLKDKWL